MAEKEEKQEEPKLTVEDMQAVFHFLLLHAGGSIGIPLEVLENYPKNLKFHANYDEVNKIWYIVLPRKKKKRGKLVLPNRSLIIPN